MAVEYLDPIDFEHPDFPEFWDDLSLWAAPFGLALLDNIPVADGLTIVDVGGGTGFAALEMAQRCGPRSKVIVIDPWSAGMARLERKLAYYGLTNVELHTESMADSDLPDACADVVMTSLGINNFVDARAVFAACRRVLRVGGTFALTTNSTAHMQEFYELFRAQLAVDAPDAIAALDADIAHRRGHDEIAALLTETGFEPSDHSVTSVRFRYADGSAFLRHWFVRLAFLPDWRDVVPENARERVFTGVEARMNDAARTAGEWVVTVPVEYIAGRAVASA